MTPAARFTAWRDELVAERDELAAQLATARADLKAADAAYSEALAQRKALDKFVESAFAGLPDHQGVALPLHSRLQAARVELTTESASQRGRAGAKLKSLEQQLTSVREAIAQVDQVLAADKVTQLPRHSEPARRRTHTPVAFDTIAPAAGVAK